MTTANENSLGKPEGVITSPPATCSAKLSVGDIVQATKDWWRVDRKVTWPAGMTAKVIEVFQVDETSPQIIAIEIKKGDRKWVMRDMVCLENVPLRKLISPNARADLPPR